MRMRLAARLILLSLYAGVVCCLPGCGDDRKRVYPVRGKVTDAAGKPLAGATITFHPIGGAAANDPKPAGFTDEDGNFILTTYKHNDGAPAGEYAVTIEWRAAPKSPADDPPDRLKGKFRDPKTSQFKVTVNKGDNELPTIQLP